MISSIVGPSGAGCTRVHVCNYLRHPPRCQAQLRARPLSCKPPCRASARRRILSSGRGRIVAHVYTSAIISGTRHTVKRNSGRAPLALQVALRGVRATACSILEPMGGNCIRVHVCNSLRHPPHAQAQLRARALCPASRLAGRPRDGVFHRWAEGRELHTCTRVQLAPAPGTRSSATPDARPLPFKPPCGTSVRRRIPSLGRGKIIAHVCNYRRTPSPRAWRGPWPAKRTTPKGFCRRRERPGSRGSRVPTPAWRKDARPVPPLQGWPHAIPLRAACAARPIHRKWSERPGGAAGHVLWVSRLE